MPVTTENNIPVCDMHTHTGFSDDCFFSMKEMLAAAHANGVKILAVTDHYDPGYPDPDFPFLLDFENYQKALMAAKEQYADRMELLTGLEVGIMHGQFDVSNEVIDAFPYDFILGSFHCHRGEDLYTFDYDGVDGPALLKDFYTYMYECLSAFDNYDVVGHFSILDRYLDTLHDYSGFWDVIDETLKIIVHKGKGLEINTSNFKYETGTWLPRESILRRFRELGGEILTFGSDAHHPDYYRFHFDEAAEFAKSLGFKYYSIFRERKPDFIAL